MREYTIAAIPGDGIGPEVIAAGLEVLQALSKKVGGFQLKVETFPWGSHYYKKHGVMMPQNGLELLRPFSAIYFGAVGAPDIPDHITLWGLRLAICQGFDQYVNLRPTRIHLFEQTKCAFRLFTLSRILICAPNEVLGIIADKQ